MITLSSNIYWHFTADKLRDGTPIPSIGKWFIYPGIPKICSRGLHASAHPWDALQYAPGALLHAVELLEITETQEDEVVAKGRKILATIDSTELLWRCARKYAVDVLHLWNAPDVVKQYLATGDPKLQNAARSAAWSAARSTAESAARSAPWSAAWCAAESAAWCAAESAARSAAWSAARSAAWSAARSAARSAAWSAARSAAWSAARSAAESAQRDIFLQEVYKEFKCK